MAEVPYRLHPTGGVIRLSDNAYIPNDTTNGDWRTYLAWMYAGNSPLPVEPIPPAPRRISKLSIWEKMTDEEIEVIAEARKAWPLRLQLMWDDATEVDPEFPPLVQFLDEAIGVERRLEVLS